MAILKLLLAHVMVVYMRWLSRGRIIFFCGNASLVRKPGLVLPLPVAFPLGLRKRLTVLSWVREMAKFICWTKMVRRFLKMARHLLMTQKLDWPLTRRMNRKRAGSIQQDTLFAR